MFIAKIIELFKKEYNVFEYNLKKNSKHLIQFEKKESDAVLYLQKLLDSELEDYCATTKDETTLAKDYLESRDYVYRIENSKFDEISYVKKNAKKVFKEYQAKQLC